MNKKALYIHGLASGSNSKTGKLLKQHLTSYEWTMAEVNHHCEESLEIIEHLLEELQPDIVCGTSLGGFYALCLAEKIQGRMLLVNPVLDAKEDNDIRQFIGENRYFCKRQDKAKTFMLTEEDCDGMRSKDFIVQQIQDNRERIDVWYSPKDEVLGEHYHLNYEELLGCRAHRSLQMGHSMTEEFIAGDLSQFMNEFLCPSHMAKKIITKSY